MGHVVHELVHSIVRQYGESTALVEGDRCLTYVDLWRRSGRLAKALADRGATRGGRVAVLLSNHVEWVESDVAISRAGAVRARLNARDSDREFTSVLLDVAPAVVITEPKFATVVQRIVDTHDALNAVVMVIGDGNGYEEAIATSDEIEDQGVTGDDPYIIFHSSGTTGHYKGALYLHRNWLNIYRNIVVALLADVTQESALLHVGPLSHQSGVLVVPGLVCGARSVVLDAFSPDTFFDAVEKHGITHTILAPAIINLLLDDPTIADRDLSSLRRIFYSGSPIAPSVLERAIKTFGPIFYQGYGSTEGGTMYNSILTPADHQYALDHDRAMLSSCGRPSAFFDVKLADDEGREVGVGEIGEIWVRGDAVSIGYWNQPEATDASYVDGWFRTGDLAVRNEDDVITIVDRKNDMIISGGLNVYPREVEDVVAELDVVREVAVIGVPDDAWGEVVKACVSLRVGCSLDLVAVQQHCARSGLASYKKPLSIDVLDDLPHTAADKVARRLLRDPYWEGRDRGVG